MDAFLNHDDWLKRQVVQRAKVHNGAFPLSRPRGDWCRYSQGLSVQWLGRRGDTKASKSHGT
jgi:hypothetical protein